MDDQRSKTTSATTFVQIKNLAEELEVDLHWAIARRVVFLKEQIRSRESLRDESLDAAKAYEAGSMTRVFLDNQVDRLNEEIGRFQRELERLRKAEAGKDNLSADRITDEMIEYARNEAPITKFVTFGRNGKATAWCHEDKNPSLYHGHRTNKAVCPVCNKFFNPVDVLMERDGLSFVDAVKEINGL